MRRRIVTVFAGLLAIALVAFLVRHVLARVVLESLARAATGYEVHFGDQQLGRDGATFRDVHVRRGGEPVFDATRVHVGYVLRDLLPGGAHRYGLTSLELTHPVLTIVRFAAGGYNVAFAGAGGGAAAAGAPLAFDVQIDGGDVRIDDRGAVAQDLREQTIGDIRARAHIDSAARTTADVRATLFARAVPGGPVRPWSLHERTLIDEPRGIALHRLWAPAIPLRGIVGFFVHTPAFRLDGGIVAPLEARAYAANAGTPDPIDYRVSASGTLREGAAKIAALVPEIEGLTGPIRVVDDAVLASNLHGTIAGIGLHARGGLFDLAAPHFRLGITGDADVHALRALFAFSHGYDVAGDAHIETVLEGPVGTPLVHTAFRSAHARYGTVPIDAARGAVDYHAGAVALDGIRAAVGGTKLTLGGRFVLGETLDASLVLGARGAGHALPYVQDVAPGALVEALAVITGDPRFHARGAIGADGGGVRGLGFFHVDERGVGEFGPFAFARADGSSLAGALRLNRPDSSSAAWVSARRFRVTLPAVIAGIPGVHVPVLPPVGGILDGDLVGGGSPSSFALAGNVRGTHVQLSRFDLGTAGTTLSGTFNDVRLADLTVDGPLGRFTGSGAFRAGIFALRGVYDGSLEALSPLTGDQRGHGLVHGPIAATLAADGTIVAQSTGAQFRGATIRGVAVERAAGTIAVEHGGLRVVAADASIGGARAVAADAGGPLALSAAALPVSALRGTGLPLSAGTLSLFGRADLRRTATFEGTVLVANGKAAGYPVAGDVQVGFFGTRADIRTADASLGATFGQVAGKLTGLGTPALRYDLDAVVRRGDIGRLGADLHLPLRHLDGTFTARLAVHGTGTEPRASGGVDAPEGSFNGLAFHDAHAAITLAPQALAAHGGSIAVGTTRLGFDASVAGRAFALDLRAPHADLDDFNDFFDESDTFDGTGRIAAGVRSDGVRLVSHGDIALAGFRYRRFPLGDTTAQWSTGGQTIHGTASVRGKAGGLDAVMSVVPQSGDIRTALTDARYTGSATLQAVDLGTWLPATGTSLPILGLIDGTVSFAGRPANLSASADLRAHDAHVGAYAVRNATLQGTYAASRLTIAHASASLDFADFRASGSVGLTATAPLALDLRATTPDAGKALHEFVPASRGYDVGGALATDVRIAGSFDHPQVDGGFDLSNAHYFGLSVPRAIGTLALSGNDVTLRDAEIILPHGGAYLAGSVPLHVAPFAIGPASAPVAFDVSARAIDLAQFAPLLPAQTHLTGTLDGRFGVEGTVARPRLLGSLAVANGSYVSQIERAPIRNVNARVTFAGSSIALEALHADVGGGTIEGSGTLDLPFGGAPRTGYAVNVRAKAARLDFPAYGSGRADGTLQLTSGTERPLLAGTIAISDATIPFSALSRAGGANPAAALPAYLDPALAIAAEAGKNVRVRSSIIDIGASGAVELGGRLSAPTLAGTFTSTGGTFSTYNHAFRVQQARVHFDPADGLLPTLDLRAVTHVTNPDPDPTRNIAGSADITLTVTGPADPNNLQIAYASSPPYSQAQIVGLLLDVPAILGAVNFNGTANSTLLRGAPGESNVLLPPGVTVEQTGTLSFNQEIFSLLNGQFTQRALSPLEGFLQAALGLSDLSLTVDYGGGVGYSVRRQIGKHDFYAALSQTLSYPERTNFGLEMRPDPFTVVNFSVFRQNGVTSLISTDIPGYETYLRRRLTSVQPLGDRAGFSFTLTKRYP